MFSAFSLSKTYAMTGVRVGYLVTPKGMGPTMRTVQESIISCVAEPDQWAALAPIVGDHSPVQDAREHYREKPRGRDRGTSTPRASGTTTHRAPFYLWIDVSHATRGDVAEWALAFLQQERVAVAPGSAFGRTGEGWIRVCLAASAEDLRRGLARCPSRRSGPHATDA